jgi:hypothetical protein
VPATYDLSTDVGKVRLLIPDRDLANPVFQDGELETFLALEGDVRRAAALALETIAADEALVLKVVSVLGLSVNGPSVAQALLVRARELRAQAEEAEARGDALFDWAEMVVDSFSARERLVNEMLREQG